MMSEEVEKFKMDLAKFSGNYPDFLVIVTTTSGRLLWKSTNKTWGIGAATRYLNSTDEWDREDERAAMQDDNKE